MYKCYNYKFSFFFFVFFFLRKFFLQIFLTSHNLFILVDYSFFLKIQISHIFLCAKTFNNK